MKDADLDPGGKKRKLKPVFRSRDILVGAGAGVKFRLSALAQT